MEKPYALCSALGWCLVGLRKANSYDVDQQVHELRVNYASDLNHLPSQQNRYMLRLGEYEGDFNIHMSKKDTLHLLSKLKTMVEGYYQVALS